MSIKQTTLALLSLAVFSSAMPVTRQVAPVALTAAQIVAIAPTSGTCEGASFPDECATADQAATALNGAFTQFGITTPGEQAALISLMAFETGDFQFNKNHFPGRPGQGTRNMQFPNFNLKYAQDIPELAAQANALANGQDVSALSDDTLNAIRELVLPDQFSFGSAAWFLTTQCAASFRTGLQAGGEPGWESYITGCVGTTVTDDRKAVFDRAVCGFGVKWWVRM